MVWYERLYIGSLVSRSAEQVRLKIEEGKYPPGVWVIVLPKGGSSVLEMMRADQLKSVYVRSGMLMIVGLAFSRTEAEYLVQKIVQQTWDAQKDADVKHFLEENVRR